MARTLRDRLVAATVRAIERDGPDDLSLRRIASDANVSRQAPYLHFTDKREMLAAAAAVAMERDRAGWIEAIADKRVPIDRLVALALAHVAFARKHPRLHALVFGPYVAKSDLPELQEQAIASFALLRETVAACLPPGTSIEQQRRCTTIAWATIKGLVDLEVNRQIPASVPGTVDDLCAQALLALVAGWRSS